MESLKRGQTKNIKTDEQGVSGRGVSQRQKKRGTGKGSPRALQRYRSNRPQMCRKSSQIRTSSATVHQSKARGGDTDLCKTAGERKEKETRRGKKRGDNKDRPRCMCLRAFVGDRVASQEWVAAALGGQTSFLSILAHAASLSSRYVTPCYLSLSLSASASQTSPSQSRFTSRLFAQATRSTGLRRRRVLVRFACVLPFSPSSRPVPSPPRPPVIPSVCVSRSGERGRQAHETRADQAGWRAAVFAQSLANAMRRAANTWRPRRRLPKPRWRLTAATRRPGRGSVPDAE